MFLSKFNDIYKFKEKFNNVKSQEESISKDVNEKISKLAKQYKKSEEVIIQELESFNGNIKNFEIYQHEPK